MEAIRKGEGKTKGGRDRKGREKGRGNGREGVPPLLILQLNHGV